MKLSDLISFQHNKERLEEIRKDRRNIVPFVGAGISKGCGLYTWGDLLHQIAVDYLTGEDILAAEAKNDLFSYADRIVSAAGNSDMIMKRIREIFAQSKINMTEIPYLLVSMFSPMIITTNYDTLLEDASNISPLGPIKPLLPCLVGQMNETIQINDRRLLKMHGSIEETQSFVFTSKQYQKFYGEKGRRKGKLLPAYLTKLFSAKKILFIGCSLERDYTLEILEESLQKNHSISHFAILPCPSNDNGRIQRNNELTRFGIQPIYYPEGDYQAVSKLLCFVAESNRFISLMEKILVENFGTDEKMAFQIQVLLSILNESYYKTAMRFPDLLDIDNRTLDCTEHTLLFPRTTRHSSDRIFDLCKSTFVAYARCGYLRCEEATTAYFFEQFEKEALKETIIEPLLQKRWSIKQHLSGTVQDDLSWLDNVSNIEINEFAASLLKTLQYSNGMNYDIRHAYCTAVELVKLAEERIDFEIRIKLLNSIGAFGYRFQDAQTAITCLEKAIRAIDECGDTSRKYMLLEAKCYANLAITKGYSGFDLRPVLEAAEKDIILKRKYNESPMLYSRSLSSYATALKELDPFRASDIYLEAAGIKEKIISDSQTPEQIRELTASWANTVFNLGLLAKDLELYDLAYRIVQYANRYRFMTLDYCNPDYCSSINVIAELELFVKEKQDIQWLIHSVESRVDLPKGFVETLDHTWYVCAYHYYLKKDYTTAVRYVNQSIEVSKRAGALADFRQGIRTELLLADIKYAQGKSMPSNVKEAIAIVNDIMNRILNLYGDESYYLILPGRHLLQMDRDIGSMSKYKHLYNELIHKYASAIRITEEKLNAYIAKHDV